MDLLNVLKLRRSVRHYSLKKVSFGSVSEICEAGMHAPMAGNIFTIKFIIVSEKDKIKLLADASQQPFIAQVPYVIVVYSKLDQIERSYGERGKIFARQQAGAVIENMLLRATDLDLGSCWIGWFDENMVKRILHIPESMQVEAILPIGHPLEKPFPKKKPELNMVASFEVHNQDVKKVKKKAFD